MADTHPAVARCAGSPGKAPLADLDAACFCGAVELHATGSPTFVAFCHCTICQRLGGSIGELTLAWKPDQVKFTKGEDNLGEFRTSGHGTRKFCKTCSSYALAEATEADEEHAMVYMPAGILARDGEVITCRDALVEATKDQIFYGSHTMDIVGDNITKWTGYPFGMSEKVE